MNSCALKVELFLKLQSVNKELSSGFESCFGASTSRIQILHALLEENEILQADLQKQLNIDPAAITRHLKQLEKSGVISRYRKDNEQRATWVKLEEVAKIEIEKSYKEKKEFIDQLFDRFTEEELSLFHKMIQRVELNIEEAVRAKESNENG